MAGALGRIKPRNWDHLTANPLSEAPPSFPTPVTIGINWYTSFDAPVQLHDGSWHLRNANRENLGTIRGGHCVCIPQMGGVRSITVNWQEFYDQGQEGACEGFGHAKSQSLTKRTTFDPWFLYDEARVLEGTYPEGEGTTNHSVARVLAAKGAPEQVGQRVATRGAPDGPVEKIQAVRWTINVEEVLKALARPNAYAVPISNSWGMDYPRVVWMPVSTLDRLLKEEGEADCVTDK
jgi:hypothetical protein